MSITVATCRHFRELGKYKQAATGLDALLKANNHDLRVRAELAETLAAQGYTKKAFDLLSDGLQTTKQYDLEEERLVIQMQLQRCFYEVYTTCSFDEAIGIATDIYKTSLIEDDNGKEQGDWSVEVLIVSYYCRLLCIGRLMHKSIPFDLESLAEERLKPMYYWSMEKGAYRQALRSAMDYNKCSLSDRKLNLLREFVKDTSVPLVVKADALMQLLPDLASAEDISPYKDALKQARTIYENQGHAHGSLDLSFRESCDRIANGTSDNEDNLPFDGYLAQYESMEYLIGEESALDLLLAALEEFAKVDVKLAILQKSREITIKGGSMLPRLLRDIIILGRWLTRTGHTAKIIENATSAWKELDHSDCHYLRGQLGQTLCLAYSMIGHQPNAIQWGQACRDMWEKCLPLDASQGRTQILRAKLLKRGIYDCSEMSHIFIEARRQVEEDVKNGFISPAIEKLEMLILHLIASPGDQEADATAKAMMTQTEQLVEQLPESDGIPKLVNLYQARVAVLLDLAHGQRGIEKEEEGLELTTKAVTMSLKVKRIFEAANTLQIAGLLVFSIFKKKPEADILQNCYDRFVAARNAFRELGALQQQATATYWLAFLLFEGWAKKWVAKEETMNALVECEKLFDAQRLEISILKAFEAIDMKQQMAQNEHVRNLYIYAIRVCLRENMTEELWEWVQKMKARSLSDLLGLGVLVPETLTSKIVSDPAARELFEKELQLTETIRKADVNDRLGFRAELDTLQSEMQEMPIFQELFALREGRPLVLAEAKELLSKTKKTHPHLNLVLVDWFVSNEEIYLSIVQDIQAMEIIQIIPTFYDISKVVKWKAEYMETPNGRDNALNTDNSEDSPFRELDFLVRPLVPLIQDGDVLVFSVSGAMHSIPIHALWIRDEVTVIDVNPVIYCANLTSFIQCWRRAHTRDPSHSAKAMIAVYEPVPGVPFKKKEQEAVYTSIQSLATTNQADVFTGSEVTQKTFGQIFESSAFIHFHGHGLFSPASITEQALLLSPPSPSVSVKDFFDLKLQSPHVTLIACDSASQSITAGDEPLGMVTAILCAGASSVIGTLWPIASGSGRLFSEGFYEQIHWNPDAERDANGKLNLDRGKEEETWIDLALVTREAILRIKETPKTRFPYYWASFVLYGAGVFRLK